MPKAQKVFGVGMSKTGTTTLGTCLEILGYQPHIGFEPQLKRWMENGGDVERVLKAAEGYRAFEDSPWYHLYRELDARFPGSKFVLTVRKDTFTHAKSSWAHGVRRGQRTGAPTKEYLEEKSRIYEAHNQAVIDYFAERPQDLLVLCWEKGDGWKELCEFLGEPIPNVPIPHANQGRYAARLPKFVANSRGYNALVRVVHGLSLTPLARSIRRRLPNANSVSPIAPKGL